ncbi:VCBS domain-containing protein [Brevundimonas lenta]|uniref:VCBS repeat-containing protein n=1 Tax=Brevundimonas lenta TaxID=424796 RepID=A0A7W6JDZ4_9CAUL|nr:VCBS domain-containing protein [Brevundimonas lenta]MBB4083364.1 VCBS repeat-containing protein [Brevundimonas lenta]
MTFVAPQAGAPIDAPEDDVRARAPFVGGPLAAPAPGDDPQTDVITGTDGGEPLQGTAGDDVIDGGAGGDHIWGRAGADVLIGGDGVDLLRYDNESSWGGRGISVNVNLATGIATDSYGDTDTISGFEGAYGTEYDDVLIGSAGNDEFGGREGNDIIDGGAGADMMFGEDGDDVIFVDDQGDLAVEYGGEGTDEVRTTLASFTLGSTAYSYNIENLTGLLTTGQTLWGNSSDNAITGGDGDDVLMGWGGADILNGGAGVDTADYRYSSAVNVNLGSGSGSGGDAAGDTLIGIENVIGGSGADTLTGDVNDNILSGGSGNDTLRGGQGLDTLHGGIGDDWYMLNSAGDANDIVVEQVGEGTDTVYTTISGYVLGANIENLVGQFAGRQTLTGNDAGNAIRVQNGPGVLNGEGGNDTLEGASGLVAADALSGGAGNDTLYGWEGGDTLNGDDGDDNMVGGAGDDSFDGGAGVDSVNYLFEGGPAGVTVNLGTGVATDTFGSTDTLISVERIFATNQTDTVTGGAGADQVYGYAGDDVLDGAGGDDILIGGTGNDVYVVDSASDMISEAAGDSADVVRTTLATFTLGATANSGNIENLTGLLSTGQTLIGNSGNNIITGGSGDDTLRGGAGADVLIGGLGLDTADYSTSTANVNVNLATNTGLQDAAGDTFNSIENVTGGSGWDNITGNAVANVLIGGAGIDSLRGGQGADTLIGGADGDNYWLEAAGDETDVIVEQAGAAGTDSVYTNLAAYTLADNVEALWGTSMTGGVLTGNALGNQIVQLGSSAVTLNGGDGNDVIYAHNTGTFADTLNGGDGIDSLFGYNGDDTLNGGAGQDALYGGRGNDAFDGGAGYDSVSYDGEGTQGLNVDLAAGTGTDAYGDTDAFVSIETVVGTAFDDRIVGDAGYNILAGRDGNDYLDGGAGDDQMIGGAGDDTYIVDSANDIVAEIGTSDTADEIRTGLATFTLGVTANSGGIENLTGTSGAGQTLTGNSGDNVIIAGSGDDSLAGGAGNDTLDGGLGADTAIFAADAASGIAVDIGGGRLQITTGAGVDTVQSIERLQFSNGTVLLNTATGNAHALGIADTATAGANGPGVAGNVLSNDIDLEGQARTVTGVAAGDEASNAALTTGGVGVAIDGAYGSLTLNADGTWTYTADDAALGAGETATETFTYRVADSNGDGDLTTLTFTITGENDAPVVTGPLTDDVSEDDVGYSYNLLDGASDVDAGASLYIDALTVTQTAGTAIDLANFNYALAIDGSGTLGFDPAWFNGLGDGDDIELTFSYNIVDDSGGVVAQTLTVTVEGQDDAPDFTDSDADVCFGEDDTLSTSGALAFAGLDRTDVHVSSAVSAIVLSGGASLTPAQQQALEAALATSVNGAVVDWSFDATAVDLNGLGDGETVEVTWTVSVDDQAGGTDSRTVTVTIHGDYETVTAPVGGGDVSGTAFDDSVTGSTDDDRIDAGDGDNVVEAGDGDDSVKAGSGSDSLDGGDGDDTLSGGGGSDVLIGGDGFDTADYSQAAGGVTARLDTKRAGNDGDGGSDTFSSIERLVGSAFNDLLIGGAAGDMLEGGLGGDTLLGGAGDDVLSGGSGAANQLQGGAGDDLYILDANDTVVELAGGGVDTVEAHIHTVNLAANVENLVFTGQGDFTGNGNAGDNVITGGAGNDLLRGGGGSDTLNGGLGVDTVDYSRASAGVHARLDIMRAVNDGDGGSDAYNSVEAIVGSAFDDLLVGGTHDDHLSGGLGRDTLLGGAGDDVLSGGQGLANQLQGGAGNDLYILDANDTVVELAGQGHDTVEARIGAWVMGANIENMYYAGPGRFIGTGNALDNMILGGDGNDILRGGGGDDQLYGGSGEDTVALRGAVGAYTITEEGIGWRIVDSVAGRDGSTYVEDIDFLRFDVGGTLVSLAGLSAPEPDAKAFAAQVMPLALDDAFLDLAGVPSTPSHTQFDSVVDTGSSAVFTFGDATVPWSMTDGMQGLLDAFDGRSHHDGHLAAIDPWAV